MTGPLTAARRLTSTATALVTATVRTGTAVASTAVHGALHLVRRDGGGQGSGRAEEHVPEPVRVPTPPDPAVRVAKQQAEAAAAKPAAKKAAAKKPAVKKAAKRAPSAKAATTGPAKAGSRTGVKATPATVAKATPKPAPPRKKASEVPLKSAPTPASAAPPEPEGPDVRPGEGGATGLAEAQPLLDPSVAAQVRSESEQLRSGAE